MEDLLVASSCNVDVSPPVLLITDWFAQQFHEVASQFLTVARKKSVFTQEVFANDFLTKEGYVSLVPRLPNDVFVVVSMSPLFETELDHELRESNGPVPSSLSGS